jgi:hypothetical protein
VLKSEGRCWNKENGQKTTHNEAKKPMKSGIENEAARTECPSYLGRTEGLKREEAVANRGFYRLGTGFCRVVTASCRVEFGFLPRLAAYYRVLPHNVFFASQAAKRGLEPIWGGSTGGFTRNKVRIVTGCYAKFHESSHRSGPWLRDVTHFHG